MGGIELISPALRILDSRVTGGAFGVGEKRDIQVLGRGAVPLSGVAGIVGNVTMLTNAAGGGYVRIWPAGYPQPGTSNVNAPASALVANQFTVMLGPTGAISVLNANAPGANILIDVQSWIRTDPLVAVGPSVSSTLTSGPSATDSVKAAAVLANAVRYAMGPWWAGPAQTMLAAPLTQAMPHDEIRRLGMAALCLSTALSTGQTDPVAVARVVQIVDHLAAGHLTNQLGGWGEGWQTPMWSSIVGRAAWLLWDQMPASTRDAVARMVAHEADYAARYQIKYYRDAAGTVISAGDSGAEEVAWQGAAMQIALAMLPTHPNAAIWQTEMQRFALAAWARPQDVA